MPNLFPSTFYLRSGLPTLIALPTIYDGFVTGRRRWTLPTPEVKMVHPWKDPGREESMSDGRNGMGTIAGIAFLALIVAAPALGGGVVTYEKDIRPIVAARCADCHGPDSPSMDEFDRDKEGYRKQEKGPRLDTYPHLMVFGKGGGRGRLDEAAG